MIPVLLAASVAVFFWGATPIATKIAVSGMDPLAAGVVRNILAALVTLPLVLFYRLRLPSTLHDRCLLVLAAGGAVVAFPILFSLGMARTSANHAGLILAAIPLPTALFGSLLERRLPPSTWWLGAAIALIGEAWLIGFGDGGSLDGDLLIVASVVSAAIGHVAGARLAPTLGTWPTTLLGVSGAGFFLLLSLPWITSGETLLETGLLAWSALIFLALGATVIAFAAWYWALSKGGIARIGSLQFVQPVVTLILAFLVLDEPIDTGLLTAAVVIMAGVILTQQRWHPS